MHAIFGPHQFETLGSPVDIVVYPYETKRYILYYTDRKLMRQVIRLGNGTYVEADRIGPENFGVDELSHIVFLSAADYTELEVQKILDWMDECPELTIGTELLKSDEAIPKRYEGALAVYKTWMSLWVDDKADGPVVPFGFNLLKL